MDPDNNSTRAQNWNATIERQFGTAWQASVSYLGSYLDRMWGGVHLNPAVFMGLGACTINGVNYATCTTNANLNQRRVLFQRESGAGAGARLRQSHRGRGHPVVPRRQVVDAPSPPPLA